MLTRLVSVLTLAATLLHSVLGCCWHHGHHGESAFACRAAMCCGGVATINPMPSSDCFGRDPEPADLSDEPQESPCDHQHGVCQEPSCVYLAAQHFQLPCDLADVGPSAIEVIDGSSETPVAYARFARETAPPPLSAPEVRALLQVWTI